MPNTQLMTESDIEVDVRAALIEPGHLSIAINDTAYDADALRAIIRRVARATRTRIRTGVGSTGTHVWAIRRDLDDL